jgi:protoporphyrinogen oxidase
LESKVGFFCKGKAYDFVTPLDLLKFTPLSLVDRLRLGVVGLYLRRYTDWHNFEGVTAQDWIIKYAGRRNYEVVWGPLLKGKFGDRAGEVGMVWFWGKVHQRFASRTKGAKERLGYLKGSFGLVVDGLAQRIRAAGGEIFHQAVGRIVVEKDKAIGLEAASQFYPFDVIVATVSAPVLLDLVPELPEPYAAKLRRVRYQSALCLVLILRRSLSPIYWLNISDPSMPFPLVVEHTNLVDKSNYGNMSVVYISNYVSKESSFYQMAPEKLLEEYLPHLRRINPEFHSSWIEDWRLFREEAAQPIVTINYSGDIPQQRTPIGGLYLANTAQSYPEDRAVNTSIRLGLMASKQGVLEY